MKSTTPRGRYALACAVLLLVAVLAVRSDEVPKRSLAATGQDCAVVAGLSCDRIDKQASTPFRSGLLTTDTLTEAGILATTTLNLTGLTGTSGSSSPQNAGACRGTIPVSAIFTDTSATCTVEVWRVCYLSDGTKVLKGKTTMTFAGGSALRAGAYWSDEQITWASGAVELRIVVTAASLGSGTLSLRVGSY